MFLEPLRPFCEHFLPNLKPIQIEQHKFYAKKKCKEKTEEIQKRNEKPAIF